MTLANGMVEMKRHSSEYIFRQEPEPSSTMEKRLQRATEVKIATKSRE
jgi:hypothetical protein